MSNPKYFDLTIPAPRRLAMMRADFAAHASRYPHCPESVKPRDWRAVRGYGLHNWAAAFATFSAGKQSDGTTFYYTHTGPEFRGERWADECEGGPSRNCGWLTNADGESYKDGSGVARGIVGRLPHGRFIAGYWWGDNGERVYYPEAFDDEGDAAKAADGHAERWADIAREDSARFNEAQDSADLIEKSRTRVCELFALRNNRRFKDVRARLAEELQALRYLIERHASEGFADYV